MPLWRAFLMFWSETCRIEFPVKVTRQVPERVWLWVLAWELSRMRFSRFSSVNQLWMTFEQSVVLSLARRRFDPHNCLSVCLSCVQVNKLYVNRTEVHQLTVINLYETRNELCSVCDPLICFRLYWHCLHTVDGLSVLLYLRTSACFFKCRENKYTKHVLIC